MIKVIPGYEAFRYPDIFDAVFALRHKVFVEEMGWSALASPNGRERDQFDDEHAVHHIALRDGVVLGYQRTLPTVRPHLLTDVLPQLCHAGSPRGPAHWEVSRYCVVPSAREGRRAVGSVGSELIVGVVEWALNRGITSLVYEFEANWLLRAVQLQFFVRPLGLLHNIGTQQIIAAELEITPHTLPTIRDFRGHQLPVVEGIESEPLRYVS
ncbi:MAG TPA: acyl-homoserine-lactone synthase [Methylovirgula sp.]|nr:acyl-homoserine-lactone synthase [Methylovirgula sp.]